MNISYSQLIADGKFKEFATLAESTMDAIIKTAIIEKLQNKKKELGALLAARMVGTSYGNT